LRQLEFAVRRHLGRVRKSVSGDLRGMRRLSADPRQRALAKLVDDLDSAARRFNELAQSAAVAASHPALAATGPPSDVSPPEAVTAQVEYLREYVRVLDSLSAKDVLQVGAVPSHGPAPQPSTRPAAEAAARQPRSDSATGTRDE